MAHVLTRLKASLETPAGRVLRTVGAALLYGGMLLLVCLYFSGTGAFIYEGF